MKKFSVKDMAEVGVLAALIFVATYFLKIGPIPTPAGNTMLKTGNAICLLGGILFGKTKGGLAAGIGSMFYDLTDPIFAPSAPFTFLSFFAMAYVCGLISAVGGNKGENRKQDAIAAVSGSITYIILYMLKTYITLVLEGNGTVAALSALGMKIVISGINAVFAVVVAVVLAPIFKKSLGKYLI